MRRLPALLPFLLLLLLAPSCDRAIPPNPDRRWQIEDLRVLEPPEPALAPENDLVAAYARRTDADLELRFDLLGSPDPYGYTLIVFVDFAPGGSRRLPGDGDAGINWDLGLMFPPAGLGQSFSADGGPASLRPRILRLAVQDAAVVRLSAEGLEEAAVRAWLIPAGASAPADAIGPFSLHGPALTARAPLLIAFRDTLPAATPLQALRRWNGAHTGPFGQRHGLKVLLDAARRSDVPLALLDLATTDALPALEALGGLEQVRAMGEGKQLILPHVSCAVEPSAPSCLEENLRAARAFRLPASAYLSAERGQPVDGREWTAIFAPSLIQPCREGDQIFLPAGADAEQVSEEGLLPTLRAELLRRALASPSAPLLVLGGRLPSSAWGDSLNAGPAMEYLAGHPWIAPLRGEELDRYLQQISFATCSVAPLPTPEDDQAALLSAEIAALPEGYFKQEAQRTLLRLTAPTPDPSLRALRQEYLGVVRLLVAAARWEAAPVPQANCAADLDGDGAADCLLASGNALAIIQPRGGRVLLLAARQGGRVAQLIGPRSQRVVGLGDPSEWRAGLGYASDPQEIAGAFGDSPADAGEYSTALVDEVLVLTHPHGATRKTFTLLPGGLRVRFETTRSGAVSVPLLVMDKESGGPGWLTSYQAEKSEQTGRFTWGMPNGPRARVQVDGADAALSSFTDALPLLRHAEDPNAEVPTGALLPFPFALVEISTPGSFTAEVTLLPDD